MAKNNPVPAATPANAVAAEVAAMSSADLRRELADQMRLTAQHMLRLAMIVRTLEERGEDLSDIRIGMLDYLRRIAYGQVLPEVVVRFAEAPMLIGRIASLPIPDQRRLADGEPVKLVVLDGGSNTHRLMDPLKLTRDQVTQVFGRDSLHDEQEQIAIIETRRARPTKTANMVRVGKVKADRERNGIVVGRVFVPAGMVLEALAALRPKGREDGEMTTVAVKLLKEEHERLKVAAARADCGMGDLVRRALWATGQLSE